MKALQQPRILVSRDQSRSGGRPNISASLKAGKTLCATSSRNVQSQKGDGKYNVNLNGDGVYCSLLEMKKELCSLQERMEIAIQCVEERQVMGLGLGCTVCELGLEKLGMVDGPVILQRGVGCSTEPQPKAKLKGSL